MRMYENPQKTSENRRKPFLYDDRGLNERKKLCNTVFCVIPAAKGRL